MRGKIFLEVLCSGVIHLQYRTNFTSGDDHTRKWYGFRVMVVLKLSGTFQYPEAFK
jgi:hypothetical protein